jgi:hypothetical protein
LKKIVTATILITVGMGVLAACSSSSPPSSSPPSSSPPSSSPPSSSPPSEPASSAATTASTPALTTDCLENQLRASIDPRAVPGNGTRDSHGATKKGVIVDFENISKTTCTLMGYPGAATVNAEGSQVTQATRTLRGELDGLPTDSDTIPTVTLAPERYADAVIEGVDQQETGAAQAGCADSLPSILVTPPNTLTAVPFDVVWPACYSFDVHPVIALTNAP